MKKITRFTPTHCRAMKAAIIDALAEVGTQFGVEITLASGGSYTDSNFSFKLNCATIGNDGEVNSPEREAFIELAEVYGLKAEDLGRCFIVNGEEYEVVGLKPKSRKYQILVKRVFDDKLVKFPAHYVKDKLHGLTKPTIRDGWPAELLNAAK